MAYQADRAHHEQLESRAPRLVVEAQRGSDWRAPGIRKEQIDAAETVDSRGVPPRNRAGGAQIRRDRERLGTRVSPDRLGGRADSSLVARCERDASTFSGERASNRESEAFARAPYHRNFVTEPQIHRVATRNGTRGSV